MSKILVGGQAYVWGVICPHVGIRVSKNNKYSQTGKIRVDRGIFDKSSYILRRQQKYDISTLLLLL